MYIMSAMVDFMRVPEVKEVIVTHLGYPEYVLDILGVAKIVAAMVLLVPRFPRLKEWAYAGLTIHIIGAIWSHLAIGDLALGGISMLLFLVATSYFFYRRVEPAGKLHFALQ
ncbi:MAG: DoxX family protein, partial [Saprospiraceae bacterium]|nr:DoxX family protein [Saprospiraceae bacterium]